MKQSHLLNLQPGIIYGPVASRRLGRSLGINLLSTQHKVCSFDCLYCQYGFTKVRCEDLKKTQYYPTADEVENALKHALYNFFPPPAYITFSGNGEATLHPEFPLIVDRVKNIRDKLAPKAQTAILSNSTEVLSQEVRPALQHLDVRIMKLDSATEDVFRQYNRPRCPVLLKEIVSSLHSMSGITIQALFTGGKRGNYFSEHINAWVETILHIHPDHVQIYSLDRSTPSVDLIRVPSQDLNKLCNILKSRGVKATAY